MIIKYFIILINLAILGIIQFFEYTFSKYLLYTNFYEMENIIYFYRCANDKLQHFALLQRLAFIKL